MANTSTHPHPESQVASDRQRQNQRLDKGAAEKLLGESGFLAPSGGLDTDKYARKLLQSRDRDANDIAKDKQAMATDRTGKEDARAMLRVNDDLIAQLNKNGKLTPDSIEKAKGIYGKFIASLEEDKKESTVYAGTHPPDQTEVDAGIKQAGNIGEYAKELASNPPPERRAELMKLIAQDAAELKRLDTGDKTVIGKDASDAGKEAANIRSDLARLASLTPGSPEYQLMVKDIHSKAGLIGRELGDIKDEKGYIAQDEKDIAQAQKMLATLGTLDPTKLAWKDRLAQIIQPLEQVNKTLAVRIALFRDDLKAEPGYIKADADDAELDRRILKSLGKDIYEPGKR